eukprot:4838866-Prymnesium_polylepis.1
MAVDVLAPNVRLVHAIREAGTLMSDRCAAWGPAPISCENRVPRTDTPAFSTVRGGVPVTCRVTRDLLFTAFGWWNTSAPTRPNGVGPALSDF